LVLDLLIRRKKELFLDLRGWKIEAPGFLFQDLLWPNNKKHIHFHATMQVLVATSFSDKCVAQQLQHKHSIIIIFCHRESSSMETSVADGRRACSLEI
jgi:hypothetical protein